LIKTSFRNVSCRVASRSYQRATGHLLRSANGVGKRKGEVYFGDTQKVWMLNFRVRDLDKMPAQLQAAGIEVKMDPQSHRNAVARVHDPERNPIELWEPVKSGAPH
jgi:predicted enzyme related to lactoylglutathione lyase